MALGVVGALAPTLFAGTSLARQRALGLEQLYRMEGPSLKLSAVYKSLPDAARYALLKQLKVMILAQLPPGIENHPGLGQLPPEVAGRLKMILPLLKMASPEQMDAFVKTQDLDHLAPLPTGLFQGYHQRAMAQKIPGSELTRAEMVALDRADPARWRELAEHAPGFLSPGDPGMDRLEILSETDPVPAEEVPAGKVKPGFRGMGVHASYTIDAPEHVLVNSVRLARALNHLSNQARRETPMQLSLPTGEAQIETAVDLVNALKRSGRYDLAVYDSRMFVNFVDLWVMHEQQPVPVRVPTWIATGIDPKDPEAKKKGGKLIVPANHAEHLLVLFKKGTRSPEALVKWYMGLPARGIEQGTIYKPAVWQRASWCGYRVVRAYEAMTSVRQMVRSAGILMRLFNFMQQRYQFERNGYAVVGVCQDTTGLMEGVLQGQTGRSTVWPLVRDPQLDFYYARVLEEMGLKLRPGIGGVPVLNIPSDARMDYYGWIQDRRVELYRIGANIPVRNPKEMHLPALRAWLSSLETGSRYFRSGLKLQSLEQKPGSLR
jgi:hypothetical protein